jgi:DNA-binding beta-propeller fold protein YncE
MDDARFQQELRRFWDEIARGEPATPGDLDPELTATIRRLHALRDVPPPDPIYARRLREDLMHTQTAPVLLDPRPRRVPNGSASPRIDWRTSPAFPRRRDRGGWALGSLVAAALLLLMLFGALIALGPLRPGDDELPGLAAVGTPVPTAPAAFVWQSEGDPDLPLDDPVRTMLDPHGNLWVTDGQNSRFQIFAPDGTFLEAWGTPGTAEGQFDFNDLSLFGGYGGGAMVFDAAGNLYVADPANYRIQKFTPDRAFVTTWGSKGDGDGQFLEITDLAVDRQGRVFVLDEGRDDVQVFADDGRFLASWGNAAEGWLVQPSGIAIDADGNLWIAHFTQHHVQKYSPDGRLLLTLGGFGTDEGEFNNPSDIAIDEQGRVYVAEWGGNRVQVFDLEGRFLTTWGTRGVGEGQFAGLNSATPDGAGNVYVAEDGADRIQKFRLLPPLAP